MSGATSPQMNITWQTNKTGSWVTFNTSTNKNPGTYYAYNTSWVNAYNTKYYWRVLINDENGGWSNTTYSFTTKENSVPTVLGANPTNGSAGVSIATSSLNITIQDQDEDHLNYIIITSPNIGSKVETDVNNGTKTCSVSGLSYSTTYTWYVQVTDGSSWTNNSYWFTTASQPSGGDPPPSQEYSSPSKNKPPSAHAGGPYRGIVNQIIRFNASQSSDDGIIVNYSWDFGDGTNGSGTYTNHSFNHSGNYTVNLTITDNLGAADTATIYALITGETSQNPQPTPPGGNETSSDIKNLYYLGDIGYLVDNDSDGIYDVFYSNETGNQTRVQKQENGTYLIDTNGDGTWDYSFDPAAGLTPYQNMNTSKKTPGFECILLFFAVLLILWKQKRKR
jgi:hypothetical protein